MREVVLETTGGMGLRKRVDGASSVLLTRSGLLKASLAGSALAAGAVMFGHAPLSGFAEDPDDATFRIMLATDPHYLSPRLIGTKSSNATISSGTMMTDYSEEIAQALVYQVVQDRPDVFLMPGDLSFGGEPESHEDYAPKLHTIADEGIPVLAIPGNHDATGVEGLSGGAAPVSFEELYERFGLCTEQTISRDQASLSYMWSIQKDGRELRFLMIDVNCVQEPGAVSKSTLAWVEDQLQDAAQVGSVVIAVSHQVLLGNTHQYGGLWISNSDELAELYERYGVLANLCGHIHGQTYNQSASGLVDAATAALSIYPLRVAYIDVRIGDSVRLDYRTETLDVSGWAADMGFDDVDLLDFTSTARFHHWRVQHDTMGEMLSGLGADSQTVDELSRYFADISCAAQDGTADQIERRQDLIEAFVQLAGDTTANRFTPYLDPASFSGANTSFSIERVLGTR